jgi:hypothetical protein
MKHQNKKKRRPTLEDFTKEKTKDQQESKTATNGNQDEIRLSHEPNPNPAPLLQQVQSLVRLEVEKALNEFKTKIALSSSKSCSKKKRDPVYIRDEDYPTVKKFRESDNEPLKETLPKVIRAAGRYLELTGGSKVH